MISERPKLRMPWWWLVLLYVLLTVGVFYLAFVVLNDDVRTREDLSDKRSRLGLGLVHDPGG
jgi:hypothetical protein